MQSYLLRHVYYEHLPQTARIWYVIIIHLFIYSVLNLQEAFQTFNDSTIQSSNHIHQLTLLSLFSYLILHHWIIPLLQKNKKNTRVKKKWWSHLAVPTKITSHLSIFPSRPWFVLPWMAPHVVWRWPPYGSSVAPQSHPLFPRTSGKTAKMGGSSHGAKQKPVFFGWI